MNFASKCTLKDVALEAGVSIDTVSRVLNGKGKEVWPSAMRRATQIREIAERLKYRPNAAARAIQSSKSRVIGTLVRNNPRNRNVSPHAFETLLGINEGLQAAGYVMAVIRYDDVEFETPTGSRVFREHMLDGMVALEGIPQHVVERLEQLVPNCVWANTSVWQDHSCIQRDEVAVGRIAAEAMLDLGYRHLVMLGGAPGKVPHYAHSQRYEGISEAARRFDAKVDRVELPWKPRITPESFPLELLDANVAFITDGTYWASWLAHMAAGIGKTPSYQFGLACCDETGEIRRYWPGLSRVSFDHYEMGIEAAKMMLRQLDNPQSPCPSVKLSSQWRPGNTAWGPQRI